MDSYIIPAIVLGGTGLIAAIVLFIVSRRFAVEEDPRIGQIEEILPGANCGACGRKGCHDFAVACASATSLDGLSCPGAGPEGMCKIAEILGMKITAESPRTALVKCNGSCANRIGHRNVRMFNSCRLMRTVAVAPDVCQWGCLGCGDCTDACRFGAITIDPTTKIATVNPNLCTGCGMCVAACPQHLIELRDKTKEAVWVACVNSDRGATARKVCHAACIGCGKCARTCPAKAITVADNHASINPDLCTACGKCIEGCPTGAIHRQDIPTSGNQSQSNQSL